MIIARAIVFRISRSTVIVPQFQTRSRFVRSMQTIEINGPKGVDSPRRAVESSGLEAETKGGEKAAGGAKKRGVECGGQSIIKPALSLLDSVNEGRGPRKKKKKKKREDAA